MGTITDYLHLNLKEKIYLFFNSTTQKKVSKQNE